MTPDAITLEYIGTKYSLNLEQKPPIEIRNMGRVQLADLFCELGFKLGVEVGVETGYYSRVLCDANPDLKLYGVDTWELYPGYRGHWSQRRLNRYYEEATALLEGKNCEFLKMTSMQALDKFDDGSLDFVYVDANHEIPWVVDDIYFWTKKVRSGGIVAGHDYYESRRYDTKNHVLYVVQCFARSYRWRPWFIVGTKEKKEGEIRDRDRSWFWVKP